MSAKLTATKNYDLFELCNFNRDIRKLRNLEASMKKDGWIDAYPMHVVKNGSGKLKIKAGHHRFETAKRLGIAAKYVVCDDTATIHQLERSTTPWAMGDYFASYCRMDKPAYLAVKAYMETTGIQLSQAIALMAGDTACSSNHAGAFKDGDYKPSENQNLATVVGQIISSCRDAGVVCSTARDFVHAISRMVYVPEFDPDVFIHRMKTNVSLLTKQVGADAYGEMIEYVYNFKSPHKVSLAFPAKMLARERSILKKS